MSNSEKPREHCILIKRWADGAKIQVRNRAYGGGWVNDDVPTWHEENEYREKPDLKLTLGRLFMIAFSPNSSSDEAWENANRPAWEEAAALYERLRYEYRLELSGRESLGLTPEEVLKALKDEQVSDVLVR